MPKRALVMVNESVGELRREPAHASEQVSQVVLGTVLTTVGHAEERRWLHAVGPDGYPGWIRSWAVHPVASGDVDAFHAGPLVELDALVARIRARADARSEGIREATLGVRLPRLGRTGRWVRVLLPDGEKGYLRVDELLIDRKTLRPRLRTHDLFSVVRCAKRFLGVPYQWGGVTAKGLDCSGLVQTVFRLHGVLLPRDAKDQFRWAARETYLYREAEEVQFGHLVFFGPSDRRVGHVGISLGAGNFLHARGRVRVNSLLPGSPDFDRDLSRQFRGAAPILLQ
jgi:hypothetical protein